MCHQNGNIFSSYTVMNASKISAKTDTDNLIFVPIKPISDI